MRKHALLSGLAACLLLLSSCKNILPALPGAERSESTEQYGERNMIAVNTENMYIRQTLIPPAGAAFVKEFRASGGLTGTIDGFYYMQNGHLYLQAFHADDKESVEIYDSTGAHVRSVPTPAFEGLDWIPYYYLTDDDSFLVTTPDTPGEDAENRLFRKYDLNGKLLAETVIPYVNGSAKWASSDTDYLCAVADLQGGTILYRLDTDMNLLSECPLDMDINTLHLTSGGSLYVQDWKNRIRLADMTTGTTKMLTTESADSNLVQIFDGTDSLFTVGQEGISAWDPAGDDRFLLDWDASNLFFKNTEVLGAWDSEHFFVSSSDNIDGKAEYAVLARAPADEPILREVVTIRPLGSTMPAWVQRAVYVFNRTNDEYYILPWESGNEYQTGMDTGWFADQLMTEITAGNAPDLQIMDTTSEELYLQLEKQGYLADLTDLAAPLTGSAKGAVMRGDQCFRIPYAIRYETLFSADGESIKASDLIEAAETMGEGACLFPEGENVMDNLISCIQSAFVDRTTETCSFEDPAFGEYLELLKNVSRYTDDDLGALQYTDNGRSGQANYTITNPALPEAIAEGKTACLPVPLYNPGIYGMAKLLYPDGNGGICGYPGTPAVISSLDSMVVLRDGKCPDGAKSFISFLLSEEIQTSAMLQEYDFPVTSKALEAALAVDHYYYFYNTYEKDVIRLSIAWKGTEADSYYAENHWRGVEYTEEDKTRLHSLAEDPAIGQLMDPTLGAIIAEEVSAYLSGDRTIDDTVRVLQSRVSTYLAE